MKVNKILNIKISCFIVIKLKFDCIIVNIIDIVNIKYLGDKGLSHHDGRRLELKFALRLIVSTPPLATSTRYRSSCIPLRSLRVPYRLTHAKGANTFVFAPCVCGKRKSNWNYYDKYSLILTYKDIDIVLRR